MAEFQGVFFLNLSIYMPTSCREPFYPCNMRSHVLSILTILLAFVSSSDALSCEKTRRKQLSALRMGLYIAQCKADGSWKSKQCHGSTGFCWCVDADGHRLGSAIPPSSNVILECKK